METPYTELIFGAKLKKDTPKSVIETLKYLTGENDKPNKLDFKVKKYNPLLGSSTYFGVSQPVTKLTKESRDKTWLLSSRANISNEENEIEDFLNWIKPYVEKGSGENNIYAITIPIDSNSPTIHSLK